MGCTTHILSVIRQTKENNSGYSMSKEWTIKDYKPVAKISGRGGHRKKTEQAISLYHEISMTTMNTIFC